MATARAIEVLRVLADGVTYREACARLGVRSPNAVFDHVERLRRAGAIEPADGTRRPVVVTALGLELLKGRSDG